MIRRLVEVIPKWPNVSGCFRFKNYYNSSNVCWFLMIGGRKLCFELPFAILSQVRLGWRSGVLGDFEGRIGVPVVQLLWLSPSSGAVACDDSRIRCRCLVACRCWMFETPASSCETRRCVVEIIIIRELGIPFSTNQDWMEWKVSCPLVN